MSRSNLARPAQQLQPLYPVIVKLVNDIAAAQQYRLRHIGDLSLLPTSLAAALTEVESTSRDVDGMAVNLAVGYAGRRDLLTAINRLLDRMSERDTMVRISEQDVSQPFATAGQPDPDLVIRTSGEIRLSGFLLWQAAEAEYMFSDKMWPDFSVHDFVDVLCDYSGRDCGLGR